MVKVATAVWEIMIIKVVRSKTKSVIIVTRPAILSGLVNSKKKETQAAQAPVNYADSDEGDSDDYLGSLEVNNVSGKDHVIWVSPEVQGRVVKMELDTGSAVSVLPYKQYKEHFCHVKLAESVVTLKTYTGQKITPKREMKCNVSLGARKRS